MVPSNVTLPFDLRLIRNYLAPFCIPLDIFSSRDVDPSLVSPFDSLGPPKDTLHLLFEFFVLLPNLDDGLIPFLSGNYVIFVNFRRGGADDHRFGANIGAGRVLGSGARRKALAQTSTCHAL